MKKYISPTFEIEIMEDTDIIATSFGNLEDLPSGGSLPELDLDQNIWN